MAWQLLPLDQLCIGLFIKVDHGWTEHPFLRSTFKISSPTEIAIIRKHGLTRILFDPAKSSPGAMAVLHASPAQKEPRISDAELAQAIETDERALLQEKAARLQTLQTHQNQLTEIASTYKQTAQDCANMMRLLREGNGEGIATATRLTHAMTELVQGHGHTATLTLVNTVRPATHAEQTAMQALNVSALACLVGRTMNLSPQELETLGMGALLYNVGMLQLLAGTRATSGTWTPEQHQTYQTYPTLGHCILANLPTPPQDTILAIVHHHRERLNGLGFPQGLKGDHLSPLSRIVGAIVEYQDLTSGPTTTPPLTPTKALAKLYRHMTHTYGETIVQQFIATVTVYPPGSFVMLNDNSIGIVLRANRHDRLRPMLILYEPGGRDRNTSVIDLVKDSSLSIQTSLDPEAIPPHILKVLHPSGFLGYTLNTGTLDPS